LNQQRIVVFVEGGYHQNGVFVLDGALEPAKDHIPVLSPKGEAGRIIGLASHMRRDQTGELSFCITLEEHLNHDNFEWRIYFTRIEYDMAERSIEKGVIYRHSAVRKATIQAVMAHHIRYIPKETPND
jgi:hypothetical protein